jgi:phosphoribosylanthranilate isomerase
MKVKICGMRDEENIKQVAALHPDYMGFIFYPESKRFVGSNLKEAQLKHLPSHIRKTGVFVNASVDAIRSAIDTYHLNAIQLHGDETVEAVIKIYLQNNNPHMHHVKIIKAFAVDASFDFAMTQPYKTFCDYFLFDTKTPSYGGSGEKYDWSLLKKYDNEVPFFLSGGISEEDIPTIKKLSGLKLYGIDVNSRLEIAPGMKDITRVKKLIELVKSA